MAGGRPCGSTFSASCNVSLSTWKNIFHSRKARDSQTRAPRSSQKYLHPQGGRAAAPKLATPCTYLPYMLNTAQHLQALSVAPAQIRNWFRIYTYPKGALRSFSQKLTGKRNDHTTDPAPPILKFQHKKSMQKIRANVRKRFSRPCLLPITKRPHDFIARRFLGAADAQGRPPPLEEPTPPAA